MELSPTNSQAEPDRIVELAQSDLVAAEDEAAVYVQRNPHDPDAYMLLGWVRFRKRDFSPAIRAFDRVRELQPENAAAHYLTAMSLRLLGDMEGTLEYLIHASRLAPKGDTTPALVAGFYFHRTGKPEQAIRVFRRLLPRRNGDPAVLLGLMLALRETGEFIEADTIARNLSSAFADSIDAQYRVLEFCQNYEFHGWTQLDHKLHLKNQIESFRKLMGPEAFPHTPETYVMPTDYSRLEAAHRLQPRTWIVKPHNLHNGHGQYLIHSPAGAPRQAGWLVQEYIANPFLFLGRKVSFRLLLLITSAVPPRIYLFDGGSCRFALLPYGGSSRDAPEELPMHMGHLGRFRHRKDLVDETTRVTGNDHHVWSWRQMAEYIASTGNDPDLLWSRMRGVAQDVVSLIEHTGILKEQIANGCRFTYGPKVIALDFHIDESLKPWLLEIESRPHQQRLFDGHRDNNPVFKELLHMTIFPLLDPGRDPVDQEGELRNYNKCAARIAEIETRRRGRFIPLCGEG